VQDSYIPSKSSGDK